MRDAKASSPGPIIGPVTAPRDSSSKAVPTAAASATKRRGIGQAQRAGRPQAWAAKGGERRRDQGERGEEWQKFEHGRCLPTLQNGVRS